jgi:hypothetical protein
MAMQIVMDHSGDTRHFFEANDAEGLKVAEERFNMLRARGFTAAARICDGQVRLVSTFDASVQETVFYPRLVGG